MSYGWQIALLILAVLVVAWLLFAPRYSLGQLVGIILRKLKGRD